ncbi:MAG: hypothetical protein PUE32_02465 [Clostridia bacterium]|nr:hypothetical protein [Clostridia bacterium]
MKKILIGLFGIVQGIIGTLWNMLALAFILHPGSAPGTKDWEEDQMFIPVGYAMLVVWLIFMFFSFYKLKKNKKDIIAFLITWLVSIAICIVVIFA